MTFKPSRFEGGGMRYLRFRRWLDEMIDLAGGLERVVFEEVRRQQLKPDGSCWAPMDGMFPWVAPSQARQR